MSLVICSRLRTVLEFMAQLSNIGYPDGNIPAIKYSFIFALVVCRPVHLCLVEVIFMLRGFRMAVTGKTPSCMVSGTVYTRFQPKPKAQLYKELRLL